MTKKEITSIALKCFALYGVYMAIILILGLMNIWTQAESFGSGQKGAYSTAAFFMALSIVMNIVFVWILWKIANSFVKPNSTDDKPNELSDSATELIQVFMICLGFLIVIRSLFDFPYHLMDYLLKGEINPSKYLTKVTLIIDVVKFVFGCILIAKPKQWASVLRSIGKIKTEQMHSD